MLQNESTTTVPDRLLTFPVSVGAKILYMSLAGHAQETGTYPGQDTLSKESGISLRSLSRFFTELAGARLISFKRSGQGKTNRVTLLYPGDPLRVFAQLRPIVATEIPSEQIATTPRKKIPIPPDVRWRIWSRDNFTCQRCGDRTHLAVDHIYPESKGGTLDVDNLQTLCKRCNSRKGAR